MNKPTYEFWHCVVGPAESKNIPRGCDIKMRLAVRNAFEQVIGSEAGELASGWGVTQEQADHISFAQLSDDMKVGVVDSYVSEGKDMPRHVRAWALLLREEKGKTVRINPPSEPTLTYAHQQDPKGIRFRQYAKDPLPPWAVDVKSGESD